MMLRDAAASSAPGFSCTLSRCCSEADPSLQAALCCIPAAEGDVQGAWGGCCAPVQGGGAAGAAGARGAGAVDFSVLEPPLPSR